MVSETEQVPWKESAEAAHRTTEVQETMDNNFKPVGDKQKNSGTRTSPTALTCRPSQSDYESELEHQQLRAANEKQLQSDPGPSLRHLEQQASRIAHEREVELRELQDQSAAQSQLLKAQWKNQMSQQATYKAAIHALHTEIANMAKSVSTSGDTLRKDVQR